MAMRVLVVAASSPLGQHLARELHLKGYQTRVLVSHLGAWQALNIHADDTLCAQASYPDAVRGCWKDIDVVMVPGDAICADNTLSYATVDYHANMNVLRDACEQGVKKFIYVSTLIGERLTHLSACKSKERFVNALVRSGLDYYVVRPSMLFSDATLLFQQATKGAVYVSNRREGVCNPIHESDLATLCVQQIHDTLRQVVVGGPEVWKTDDMVHVACSAAQRSARIRHLPTWLLPLTAWKTPFLTRQLRGQTDYLRAIVSNKTLAPPFGVKTLHAHFLQLAKNKATGEEAV